MVKQLFVTTLILSSIPTFGFSAAPSSAIDVKTRAANASASASASNAAASASAADVVASAEIKAKASAGQKGQLQPSLSGTIVGNVTGLLPELESIVLDYINDGPLKRMGCLFNCGKVTVLKELRDGRLAIGTTYSDWRGRRDIATSGVWDISSRTCVVNLDKDDNTIAVCVIQELRDGRLATGYANGRVRVWDVALEDPSKSVIALEGHNKEICALEESRDGSLTSRAVDGSVRTWDISTGECLEKLEGQCLPRIMSRHGDYEFEVEGGNINIWNVSTSDLYRTLRVGEHNISAIQEIRGGDMLVAGCEDGTIYFWHRSGASVQKTQSSWLYRVFNGGSNPEVIQAFQELTDGRVAALTRGGEVRIWEPYTNTEWVETLKGEYTERPGGGNWGDNSSWHHNKILAMLVLRNGKLLTNDEDGSLDVWVQQQRAGLTRQAGAQSNCLVQ